MARILSLTTAVTSLQDITTWKVVLKYLSNLFELRHFS